LQLDEQEHSQLGDIVSELQDYVEVDDEMKSKLKDVYQNVTKLSVDRGTQLRLSLQVPLKHFARIHNIVLNF